MAVEELALAATADEAVLSVNPSESRDNYVVTRIIGQTLALIDSVLHACKELCLLHCFRALESNVTVNHFGGPR